MPNETTYKRCGCRDGGKMLGQQCPRLRRPTGSWNPAHGTWYRKTELPPAPDGKRIVLHVGGFARLDELDEWFSAALLLMSIPEAGPDGHAARTEILEMIRTARADRAPLPDYDDLRRRYAEGVAFEPGSAGSYLTDWLGRHKQAQDWSPTTEHHYARAVDRLFIPVFGDVPLSKLQSRHVFAMLAAIDAENERIVAARASGDPAVRKTVAGVRTVGQSSKKRYLAILHAALEEAMSPPHRLIGTNPAHGIRLGKGGRKGARVRAKLWTAERERGFWEFCAAQLADVAQPSKAQRFAVWRSAAARPGPVMVWTPAQLGRFLDSIEDHRLYPLFCVIAHCALRRGEACGLPWTEVNWDAAAIQISTQTVTVGWQTVTSTPKTDSSIAVVRLDDETAGVLRGQQARQQAEKEAWTGAWADTGLVFTHEDGTAYHPGSLTTALERLAFAAGLPPVRLHDLRHCAATLALAGGADITSVSRLLRHASIQITADVYAEVLPELALEVASKVVRMVPRSRRNAGATDVRPAARDESRPAEAT
jgi:integrase